MLAFESFLDLDPRLGNPDHGFEIFLLDLQTREITQVTNTAEVTPVLDGIDGTGDDLVGEVIDLSRHPARRSPPRASCARSARPISHRCWSRCPSAWCCAPTAPPASSSRPRTRTAILLAYYLQSPDGVEAMARNPVLLIDSKVEQDGSGTATLTMSPGSGDAGDYRLRVAVFDDEGGVAIEDTDLAVISSCPSDCNGDEEVSIDEVISAVSIGLEIQPLSHCEAADTSENGEVSIDEVLQGVGAGLSSCAPFLAGQP